MVSGLRIRGNTILKNKVKQKRKLEVEGRITDLKTLYQAKCNYKSAVSKNNRRDSTRTVSLLRVKVRVVRDNKMMKNLKKKV